MELSRGRGATLLVATVVALVLAVVTSGAASGAASAAPSVTLRQTASGKVSVTGRTAAASAPVRFQRHTASGWRFVERVRSHHHHYRATLTARAGSTVRFRVTSNGRSRTFTVRMAAAKTAQPTLYDDCGARPRKPDGSAWSCTFHDDFDGTALDRTKWVPQTVFADGGPAAYTCYRDDPTNVSVSGGMLDLTLVRLVAPAPCGRPDLPPTVYQSGSVSTYHLFSQQYGRFQARMRTTASTAPGLHEAFWLWPDDRYSTISWPQSGEIDVAETYSSQPKLAIPFLHYSADAGGPQPGVNTAWNCTAARGQWNTYTLEWGPSRIAVSVNGRTCLVNTSGDPAFRKAYIVSLTQGLEAASANTLTPATPVPATLQVDYVRVWR